MTADRFRVLYIHGFNSSPDSQKAQSLLRYCRQHPPLSAVIPRLHFSPALAIAALEDIIENGCSPVRLVIGSSLGGYYATWLSQKYGIRAALVNPAVSPGKALRTEFLGRHSNPYTGEKYEITVEYAAQLNEFETETILKPENFLLLVQTGDEVLDYRLAVEKYRQAEQIVEPGGDHSFVNFEAMLPRILAFGGFAD